METGQMQEEQQHAQQSPFDQGLFFPDKGRKSTLEALRSAVTDSVSLITCIGGEGHGKTMLCKILGKEISEPYLVIPFPYSVESFDYVLQIIALKLNLNFSLEDNAMGSGHLLMEIARTLREQNTRLLILFDEAEKLYLATLERVRKMIDLVNEDAVLLQIVLFGRMEFQKHIEQLALCTFKNAQELHLVLPPLTEEDTFQYLNFCMQQRPGVEKKDIFSREVAAKILAVSHGNFRKINSLAGDSLRSSSYTTNNTADGTSFMVLLEHVKDSDDLVVGKPPAHRLPFLFMQQKAAIGAGIILIATLLFLSVSKEDKKTTLPAKSAKTQMTTHQKTHQTAPNNKEIGKQPTPPAPVAATEPVTKPVPPAPVAAAVPVAKPAPPAPITAAEPVVKPTPPAPVAAADPAAKPISVEIAPLIEKKSSEIQIITADKSPKKNTIPHLTPEPITKNNELLLKGKKELKANISQQLPRKSLAAGDRWLAGEKNDQFTLQVMVLATDQASEKFKEILHEEDQQGSEKFIILKKATSPTTLTLFYGEYPTLTAARNARNNLPQSLQKYTPYPVAVKQAVEKSK
ncbi:MAG: AAA family ATPase [Desulfocapsaceae bacterium]|nr:AAA family ATPase [Desulfocapsaceae bacterium]